MHPITEGGILVIFLIPVHTDISRKKISKQRTQVILPCISLRENNFNRVLKKFHPWECSETFWFVIYIFFRIWLTTFYMGFLGMFYLYSGLKNAKIQYFWLFWLFSFFFSKQKKNERWDKKTEVLPDGTNNLRIKNEINHFEKCEKRKI